MLTYATNCGCWCDDSFTHYSAGVIEQRTSAPSKSQRKRQRRKSQIAQQKWLDRHLDKLSQHAELHGVCRCCAYTRAPCCTLTFVLPRVQERTIHGLHTYDIHANPDYRTRFGMDLPMAEHMVRGNFWTQRGTEWSRRGVDVRSALHTRVWC